MFLVFLPVIQAGRILVFPYAYGYNTRLRDMVTLTGMLIENGHEVYVLINDNDIKYYDGVQGVINYFTFPPPGHLPNYETDEARDIVLTPGLEGVNKQLNYLVSLMMAYCDVIIKEHNLLRDLKNINADLFLLDSIEGCGRVLTFYLDIPVVTYSSHGYVIEPAFFPLLPSFIPVPFSGKSWKMDLKERIINTLYYWFFAVNVRFMGFADFETWAEKHKILNVTQPLEYAYVNTLQLIQCDTALDFPRPLFPNIKCIGGIMNTPANHLDDELETFMQSSGDAGVILVSFGTLINRLNSAEKAITIGKALARLPQKVIWRYKGKQPEFVGKNTRVMEWVPQNDLLGHPKLKAFVTHCGSHSTFEAAYHGTPVIAVPLGYDQVDHATKMVERAGMGLQISYWTLTEDELFEVMQKVVNTPKYKKNAMETSQLLRDRPISPKDEFLYYIDYVIRHKGSGPRNADVMNDLNMLQLYCIDVIAILLAIVFTLIGILVFACKRMCRYCLSSNKPKTD